MQYDISPNHCKGWPSQRRALVPPVSKPTLFFHQLSPERFVDTRDRCPSLSISLGARVPVYVQVKMWVCDMSVHLSYRTMFVQNRGIVLGNTSIPVPVRNATTQRPASEPGARGALACLGGGDGFPC